MWWLHKDVRKYDLVDLSELSIKEQVDVRCQLLAINSDFSSVADYILLD